MCLAPPSAAQVGPHLVVPAKPAATRLMPPRAGSRSMRARLGALALVLVPLIAGCVSTPAAVEPSAAADGILPPLTNVTRSLGVDLTRWSGEPSILAMRDGTLLITGAGGMTRFAENPLDIPGNFGQSYIWRSVDDGATWEFVDLDLPEPAAALLPYRNAIFGVEGDLAEDEAGRAYFVDLTMLVTNGVAASDDGGATWTAAQSPVVGQPAADRPWVAAMGDGVAYMKYLATAEGHRVTRSTDGGLTWPEDVPLMPCGQGAPIVDFAMHDVIIPCTDGRSLFLLKTAEGVMQWQRIDIGEADGNPDNVFVSAAVAGPGQYLYAWADATENLTRVRVVASTDGGDTWGAPLNLSAENVTGVFPWVDANANGTVAVVWYEADLPGPSDAIDAAWWPKHASLLLTESGLALGDVQRLSADKVHQGAICTSGLGCVVDGRSEDRRLLDFFEVDVDDAGRSHVAFTTTQTDVPTVWYAQVVPVAG